jgi:hypothetical protein
MNADAHMKYCDLASVPIYLDDMSQFQKVNAIYKEESAARSNDRAGRQVVLGCSHRDLGYRAQMMLRNERQK